MSADRLTRMPPRAETCDQHGEFEARNVLRGIWTRCPECAIKAREHETAERERREREEANERWQRNLGHAGIPVRFKDRSLKSYVAETDGQRRALAFAEAYADSFDDVLATGRSAVFIGKLGTGKTHLAVGIGLRIMRRDGLTVHFSTVMRAIRRIRNTWGGNGEESETAAIDSLTRPDLLILDEVGIQYGSAAEKLTIFDILNERYERRRPTLLLSNLDVDGVRAHLGDRVFDRLREDGGEVVVFDWESYRGTV